jgi:hypothetical protein
MNIDDLLEHVKYRRTLRNRGVSLKPREPTTLATYRRIYTEFDNFCKGRWTVEKVKVFMDHFPATNSKRTVYYALKSAFIVLKIPWFTLDYDPLPPPSKNPERPFYTAEEMGRILAAARHNLKHYLILRITFLAGPRRIQMTRIRATDYDARRGVVNIPGAKQTPEGEWLCDPLTRRLLDEYMEFHKKRWTYLFPSREGTPEGQMNGDTIRRIFEHYCEVAGVLYREQGFKHGKAAHGARRGRVTNLFAMGFREDEITKALRWTNPFTVHTYIQKLAPQVMQDIAARDPFYSQEIVDGRIGKRALPKIQGSNPRTES